MLSWFDYFVLIGFNLCIGLATIWYVTPMRDNIKSIKINIERLEGKIDLIDKKLNWIDQRVTKLEKK